MPHPTSYKLPLLQDNIFQVRLATMTSAGIVTLLTTAISPLLTTCLLWFLGIQLLLSIENWRRWPQVELPQADITLDHSIKVLIGAVALLSATFVVQLHVVSQMVLLTTTALSLSAYFTYPCMKNTQIALNTALQQATQALEAEKIAALLNRGADPYYPDEMGNNAFHLAIQENESAIEILALLKNKPTPATFSQIGDDTRLLLDDEIKAYGSSIGTKIQVWLENRTQNNFYPILQEFKNLLAAFHPRLNKIFNTFISFLRGEMSVPNHYFYKNNAGSTPLDLIGLNIKSEAVTQQLRDFFLPDTYQEPAPVNMAQPPRSKTPAGTQTEAEHTPSKADEHDESLSPNHPRNKK
tara:strand:+ start:45935 stop:46993 length:1059 start_codon:yes stop_codon:yes gene_type:complete